MHLIATREDLGTFAHAHPQPTGRPGQLAIDLVFPTAGRYVVNTEFRRQGQLSAAGHVVVMRADAVTFAHEHVEVENDRGRPVFALPGQTFGPQLDVHAEFPTPGRYRIWGQFRLADGRVITAPFTVTAS